jgi:uncharacterized protein YbaR (Trm112 family)
MAKTLFGIFHWTFYISMVLAPQTWENGMSLSPELKEILVCPQCKGELEYRTQPKEELVCHKCRLIYAIEDDIPIMLIDEAVRF